MPRYYFELHEHDKVLEDQEGSELANAAAAHWEAAAALGDIVKDIICQ